jgi:hypothetical protein
MKKSIALLMMVIFLSGCGLYGMTKSDPKPTQTDFQTADFGDPPGNYQEQVQSYFNSNLANPIGIILEFGSPYKSWAQLPKEPNTRFPATYGFKNAFGWTVCGYINAQNRFGGYTGRNMFWTFFEGGILKRATWGAQAWDFCRGNEPKL